MNDRQFLKLHMQEFREQVLNDLDTDEIVEVLNDPMEFGWNVRTRFEEWRTEYENKAREAEIALEQERASDMRQRG